MVNVVETWKYTKEEDCKAKAESNTGSRHCWWLSCLQVWRNGEFLFLLYMLLVMYVRRCALLYIGLEAWIFKLCMCGTRSNFVGARPWLWVSPTAAAHRGVEFHGVDFFIFKSNISFRKKIFSCWSSMTCCSFNCIDQVCFN